MAVPDARVELQIGGSWIDETAIVRKADGMIKHARGRRSEGARVDAAETSVLFDDPNGNLNSRNPRSPYYGQLGRNIPLRYSVDGANVALVLPSGAAARAQTPDNAALDITGDIDIRADLTPSSWYGGRDGFAWEVLGKVASTQASYWVIVQDDGTIGFQWSTTGSDVLFETSTRGVPFGAGERGAIRITLDVNNGAGGQTTTFYTAPTIAGPWTQLGDVVTTTGTTSIFSGSAVLQVGDLTSTSFQSISRLVHAVEIRNGIGGTVVANPDFSAQPSGTTSFTDGAGRVWALAASAAEITSRRTRTVGEIAEWLPRWHVSGLDVTARVTATGILRRLNQGRRPLRSAITRGILALGPVAYWPLEDGRDSTLAASPLTGVQALMVSGLSMAAESSLPASAPLPTIGTASTMTGLMPTTNPTDWAIHFFYNLPSAPASSSTVLEWTTTGSPWRLWRLKFTPTDFELYVESGTGSPTLVTSGNMTVVHGTGWQQFTVRVEPAGADLDVFTSFFGTGFLASTFMGQITSITTQFGAGLSGASIGHLAIYDSQVTEDAGMLTAYFGETAGTRVARLGVEEAIPTDVWGDPLTQEAMGYQLPGKLLDLLGECEAADGGILMEDRTRLGLVYRSRETLYSQEAVLTVPYGHLSELGPPTDDDRRVRNDRTVNRTSGSSGRWVLDTGSESVQDPPAGAGLYDDEVTLNLAEDSQCEPLAQWLVHLGTVDEARYPRIRLLLHKYPEHVDAVTRLDVGSVIRVTNLPDFLPPGPLDLLVEGYEETLGPLSWEISITCSPASPWAVGALEDATHSELDTDVSTLASSVTSTGTTLSVATASGVLWTTDAGDRPFDIRVGGEVMTVTNVTGASSPQTFTVTRSVNGVVKAQSSGADVRLATPTILAL